MPKEMERHFPKENESSFEVTPDQTIKLTESQLSHAGKLTLHVSRGRDHLKFLDNDIEALKRENGGSKA